MSMPKLSILIDEIPEGFFSSSRGIRQGDPISSFLFIIMEEKIGRVIEKDQEENKIIGVVL